MRPVRLQVEGFTAFREPVEVDLDGVSLFALTGPTGSGKSSLIDAMIFALYGSVPRYDDRRAVEPVVSLGMEVAKVRFDFTVGDDTYSAVRVVKRTKSGATTAEARLVRLAGGAETDVVAGAREVTTAVEELLGLGFEHFTRCVVLPQGEFAEFLHDAGENRRGLLRRLLDVGVYGRMRSAAETRSRDASKEAELIEDSLTGLAGVTEEAEAALMERIGALSSLADAVDKALPELAALEEAAARAESEHATASERIVLLERLGVPAGTEDLAGRHAAARDGLQEAEGKLAAATGELKKAEEMAAGHRSVALLEARLARHVELAALRERRERELGAVSEAKAAAAEAGETAAEAEARLTQARADLAEAERRHGAHVLANGLTVGDVCPVCRREIEEAIPEEVPADLELVRRGLAEAERLADSTARALRGAETGLASREAALVEVDRAISRLADELGGEGPEALEGELTSARTAAEAVAAARRARTEAEESCDRFRAAVRNQASEIDTAWAGFDRARDSVAVLDPPLPASRDDLLAAWRALVAWAADRRVGLVEQAARLREDAAASRERAHRRREELGELLAVNGLEPSDRPPAEVVAVAATAARQQLEVLRRDRERKAGLEQRLHSCRGAGAVAKELARLLRGDRFEQWLLEEAFAALVAGANVMLDELTGGAYSLSVSGTEFSIVDHRNADQTRGVKTLSGGETFLVSLALALALAEQLASISIGGAARLESIFLDEGFGTLDADTLDLVASVIDDLGARGRTVGIVTHVSELAERMPVRFEVTKAGPSATVRKVEA